MRNLKDILRESGNYQEPPRQTLDIPEWSEPQEPVKRFYTLNDLIGGGGQLLAILGAAMQYLIGLVIWLFVAYILLLSILHGGCHA